MKRSRLPVRAAAARAAGLSLTSGAALSCVSAAAHAQEAEDAAESRSTSFQAVEGPQQEQVPGGPLLVAAYAFVLVLVVGYVARIARMQARTAAEVERLTRAIEQSKRG